MATLRQVFGDIAQAIREKGVSGTFKPIEMAQKIGEISGGGEDYGYLTFTAQQASTLKLGKSGTIEYPKLLKSTDAVNWQIWNNPNTNTISLSSGQSVYIKAADDASYRTATGSSAYNRLVMTGKIQVSGDSRSIVKLVAPADYSYWLAQLFYGSASLTQAPELPAKTMTTNCYYQMFLNCTSLVQAPELPATTLATYCYQAMFQGCTSLIAAPALPATTLTNSCYLYMFQGCTSLTTAPELPATTLTSNCYNTMFKDCTSLTTAPELPAKTMTTQCYYQMFRGCTSLKSAPQILPATTLANDCYYLMFSGCSSLTQAPELPATNLANNCYNSMFSGCSSLTQAPELPATNLASQCYGSMFKDCTSLTTAPELPAKTMTTNCYQYMFQNCTSLKRIKMNASSGNWGTYMFSGCTSLELVDMTGSTGVPTLGNVNNFQNTNDTYKIVVPDSLYDKWIVATNWSSASIKPHIMKQSDWNSEHPDNQL